MNHEDFNWCGGVVENWELAGCQEPLSHNSLTEGVAQVYYPNGCLIDVGWYPSGNEDPHAFTVIVLGPGHFVDGAGLFETVAHTLEELRSALQQAIQVAATGEGAT